ncbi:MAG: hypothetical protein ACR2ML_00485 [Solirubrobacteraceae bacterium]
MTDFAKILGDLNSAEVEYVLIGGLAVISHGVVRATRDVDAIVADDDENLARIEAVVEEWGATRPDGSPIPEGWVRARRTLNLATPHGGVDLIPERTVGQDYAGLAERSSIRQVEGVPAPIVGLADLAAIKRAAGRPADDLDLSRLREAHGSLPGD